MITYLNKIVYAHRMEFEVDKRVKVAREIAKIAGVASLALSLVATISFLNSPSKSFFDSELSSIEELFETDNLESSSWDDSWVPAGFKAWSEDSNIAWRWAAKHNCQDYGCISAEFISQYGCPSGLYAAINWLDTSDSVVSYSNDSIPSLLSMQIAKMRFDDIEDIGDSGQMSTINCR